MAEHNTRHAAETGERDQQPRDALPLAGAVQGCDVSSSNLQQVAHARAGGSAGPLDGFPRRDICQRLPGHRGHTGLPVAGRHQHPQHPCSHFCKLLRRDDGIQQTALEEVLRLLHPGGER